MFASINPYAPQSTFLIKQQLKEQSLSPEIEAVLKKVIEKFEKCVAGLVGVHKEYVLDPDKINIVITHLKKALEDKLVTVKEIENARPAEIRDVFITSYGVEALKKGLFTFEESRQITSSAIFTSLMTDKGMIFLDNLKQHQMSLIDIGLVNPLLIDNMIEKNDIQAIITKKCEREIKKEDSDASSYSLPESLLSHFGNEIQYVLSVRSLSSVIQREECMEYPRSSVRSIQQQLSSAVNESKSSPEVEAMLTSIRKGMNRLNDSSQKFVLKDTLDTILNNIREAVQRNLISLDNVNQTSYPNIRDVFQTRYGLIALEKHLFTLKEAEKIQSSVFMALMTEKGILFLETLKQQHKKTLLDITSIPTYLIDKIIEKNDVDVVLTENYSKYEIEKKKDVSQDPSSRSHVVSDQDCIDYAREYLTDRGRRLRRSR